MSEQPVEPGLGGAVRNLRPLEEVVAEESGRSGRRRWVIGTIVALAVAGLAGGIYSVLRGRELPVAERFTTMPVTRGTIEAHVSATGRIEARSTVDVGAEISGRVVTVEVDFDDVVEEGQILVRFDTQSLAAQVAQARASQKTAEASLRQARVDRKQARSRLARVEQLHAKGIDSDEALELAQVGVEGAEARVLSASAQVQFQRASLHLVETNLSKAVVVAPISGVVISRNVDPGQTVAAAFQTPVLLTIAEDLTKMRVTAPIDEADVGSVAVGQRATFTVDAYPGREFQADVASLRNAPAVVQSVVSYDAILEVENPDLSLRPGMTASVRVQTKALDDALLVPNAALRFLPPGEAVRADPGVWALEGDALQWTAVTPGVSDGRSTAVESSVLDVDTALLTGLTDEGRKAYERTDER